jgi:cell division protein FtsI/penicillin-binding protein 2
MAADLGRIAMRRLFAALTVICVAGGLGACSQDDAPIKAMQAFVGAWQEGKLGGLSLLDPGGSPLAGDAAQSQLTALEGDLAARRPRLTLTGKPTVHMDDATQGVSVDWPVADAVVWNYPTTVRVQRKGDKWLPVFGPQTVNPNLAGGAKLSVKRRPADRAQILDGSGQPIVDNRPVVVVGVEPRRVTDVNVLIGTLRSIFTELALDVDLTSLPTRVSSARPDAFVEVVTLRREAYDRVKLALKNADGTVFREATLPLAPSTAFARALLGGVGAVTKEILDKNPGKYQVGDVVGTSGLQQRYDERLRGRTGVSVVIPGAAGQPDKELFSAQPQAGAAVKTTLDAKIQNAADAALTGEKRRSALIAVRVSDGAVLAVANGPDGGRLNLALTAHVPPGSTFKMVTALGVLDAGSVGLDAPVDCPKTLTVEGRTFKNAHDMELGSVPLRVDFAKSCNTAFASLAPKLGPDGLAKPAASVGVGVPWDIGADAFTGTVSSGGSGAERAAAAFGQGTTVVSPVALAVAAATVARGQWKAPSLVVDPAPPATTPAVPAPIKPESLAALRTMMREVVTAGTASALAALPGEPVYGKTGTAEFDNTNPANTHAWFIGWRGDIAFAAFVENGGAGSDSAVPVVGKFLLSSGG